MMVGLQRISPASIIDVVNDAVGAGQLDGQSWAIFHNLDLFTANLEAVQAAFPAGSLHTLAIKANPLVRLLQVAVDKGYGLEAASMGEVHLAIAAECPASRIVFDSPAKTTDELAEALQRQLRINADNRHELERIEALVGDYPTSNVGLRINPQVGAGHIASTSVAHRGSKFGVPIDDWASISSCFRQYSWLRGLHVHVGSQGCEIKQLVEGVCRITQLAQRLTDHLGRQSIDWLDIGGGLPVAYKVGDDPPHVSLYADALRSAAPDLFTGETEIVTEFGRLLQAGCGWAVSRVEYVKQGAEGQFAVVHFGADFLMRAVYAPTDWQHEYILCDSSGRRKTGDSKPVSVAGPLCFAGDVPAQELMLPEVAVGDLLIVRDVGAYTLGLWSHHCSRPRPKVIGYCREARGYKYTVLKDRDRPTDVVALWS